MAIVDQIQSSNGEVRDIGAASQNVSYTNQSKPNVSNTKQALDELFANGGGSGGGTTTVAGVPYFKNPPLPRWKDSLKVLIIGNSYTLYSLGSYMATILNELQIGKNDIVLRNMHGQAYPLSSWLNLFRNKSNGGCQPYFDYNDGASSPWYYHSADMGTGNIYNSIAGTPWDVIVFQTYPQWQSSGECSTNYSTFASTIKDFIREIRMVCPNKDVAFGYHMIWAKDQSRSSNASTWSSIAKATKDMIADSGVDIIIPTGTAFQNAVNTNTFKGEGHSFLMSDGTGHPAQGVARYIAACTIWESLFAPVLGKSMYGLNQVTSFTPQTNPVALTGSEIEITSSNIRLCQKVAMAAISDRWTANTTIDPIVET